MAALQQVTSNGMLTFMKDVKEEFKNYKEKYNKFLKVMKDFMAQQGNSISDTVSLIQRVKEVFQGRRKLILGFNKFLSPGYEILVPSKSRLIMGSNVGARSWHGLRRRSRALMQYVTVQLASHLDVLYTVEFSFKSNGSQQRSICVFGAYIEASLTGFSGGPYCPRQGIFQTFCKFLLINLAMHYMSRFWKMKTLSSLHVYIFLCDF